MLTVVCFGNSVTQGTPHVREADTFPAVLGRRISRRLEVTGASGGVTCVNSGVSGENTEEGLARFQESVAAYNPALVVVEFGLNDLRYEPEKYLPEAQFAANLKTIGRRCADGGAEVLYTTPNPIINRFHVYSHGIEFYKRWKGCNGAVQVYAQVVREVAHETGAMLADVYAAFEAVAVGMEFDGLTDDWQTLECLSGYIKPEDGVHPTTAGQALIARTVYHALAVAGWMARVGRR